jgi:hypothetical protein
MPDEADEDGHAGEDRLTIEDLTYLAGASARRGDLLKKPAC